MEAQAALQQAQQEKFALEQWANQWQEEEDREWSSHEPSEPHISDSPEEEEEEEEEYEDEDDEEPASDVPSTAVRSSRHTCSAHVITVPKLVLHAGTTTVTQA